MAVKTITNTNPELVNRATQTTFRDTSRTSKGGNRKQTVSGKNYVGNFAVTLKDLDMAVMHHVRDVMSVRVREANETVKVPVMYGNEERWASIKRRGTLRDRKGTIILPVITFKRTQVNFNDALPQSFDHDIRGDFISVTRASKYSKKNQYDRFNVLNGVQPIQDRIVTAMPDFVVCDYEFVIMTSYTEQMNGIVESFVAQNNKYFGNNTDYRFCCYIDGWSDASEMDVMGERLIKTTFSLGLKGYLYPETIASIIDNKRFTTKKTQTIAKVVFEEGSSDGIPTGEGNIQ